MHHHAAMMVMMLSVMVVMLSVMGACRCRCSCQHYRHENYRQKNQYPAAHYRPPFVGRVSRSLCEILQVNPQSSYTSVYASWISVCRKTSSPFPERLPKSSGPPPPVSSMASSPTPFCSDSQPLSTLAIEKDAPLHMPILLARKKNYPFSAPVTLEYYAVRLQFPTTSHASPPSRFLKAPLQQDRVSEEPTLYIC